MTSGMDNLAQTALRNEKRRLRKHYLALRQQMDVLVRQQADALIRQQVVTLLTDLVSKRALTGEKATKVVGLYHPIDSEIDVLQMSTQLREQGWSIVLPRTEVETRTMQFYVVDEHSPLLSGVYGIQEPDPAHCQVVAPEDITFLVIPGMAFTKSGIRLGYGGGYYDRYLSHANLDATRIAIAYDAQLVFELPVEAHDGRMHYVVTDKELYQCAP